MNIPRPDPVPSRGVSDLDRHIETLLRVIHSRNLAWSDLSEVGKQVERPLTDVEQLLTNVGDDAHEITLATETIITALKLQRDALAIQSSRRRARFGSMLLLMIPVFFVGLMIGASYGIDEGRAREREALKYPMIPQLSVDRGGLKTDGR
ncbi:MULTISPECIES: hypothetical protein [Sphingomonadaceae]|jgi:hypothetical protein|uniref:Uncharacterized protein n=2 Tax=Sphingomonadaceae TaxID=41297 RepID=A0A0J7XG82_9SPHN|nr:MULTISPECIES: hypothetical protein [Sphingomonadaceae]OHC43083.1 MAG: hypothetical protein A2092_19405 [Rhodobacteraceae bacterium GWE1_64_9]OYY13949.1 MAG: hypothetical protein B7Y70_00335 [Rhizobiales bacterium 35-68-8]AMK26854.1 hypothetical protein K426_29815 [Sphingobium sp. TKS]EQB00146.1 hypothetical protein L485_14585 [Sphingobium baderi LL03]KMS50714.1 hypothetical protein V474_06335 [Novosphingobium barchaimii LL02]